MPSIQEWDDNLPDGLNVKKSWRKLATLVGADEEIMFLDSAGCEGHMGLLAVTDRRVMWVFEAMTKGKLEDFPYESITSVDFGKRMMAGDMTIFASGDQCHFGMTKKLVDPIGAYVRRRIAEVKAAPAQSAPSAPAPDVDPLDRLKKLAELRDAGVLSKKEFEEQKAKLLAET